MEKKLFVGGLSYNTTEDELKMAFEAAGDVASVVIIKDRDTGRSKGFGFVEMMTVEGAENALRQLDGSTLDGRKIGIKEAEKREKGNFGGGGRPSSRGFQDKPHKGGWETGRDKHSRPESRSPSGFRDESRGSGKHRGRDDN